MIDLTPEELETVKQLLRQHLPSCEVRAFGSRITGTAKPYSGLNLLIIGKQNLDLMLMAEVKDSFAISDLTFRVDLLDWHGISNEFKAVIDR